MKRQRVRRLFPIIVGVAASAATVSVSSTAASPPSFDIHAKGAVSFGCLKGGGFPKCKPFIYVISGKAPASGAPVGANATFSTHEVATPISATKNHISAYASITAADGDKVDIHYYGTSPAPAADQTGVGHLNDNLLFTIIGGTGRFRNARGSGRLIAGGAVYYTARPTVVSSELTGTIKLPAP